MGVADGAVDVPRRPGRPDRGEVRRLGLGRRAGSGDPAVALVALLGLYMIWKINGRALSASGVKSADLPLDRCERNETQIALPAHVVAVDDADIVDLRSHGAGGLDERCRPTVGQP